MFSIDFFKMILPKNLNVIFEKIVELIELYKTASKYFWLGMDRRCEKVTLSSISIVKCMDGIFSNCF